MKASGGLVIKPVQHPQSKYLAITLPWTDQQIHYTANNANNLVHRAGYSPSVNICSTWNSRVNSQNLLMLHSLGVDTTAPELFPDLTAVKMTTAGIFKEPRCQEAADKSSAQAKSQLPCRSRSLRVKSASRLKAEGADVCGVMLGPDPNIE